MSSFSQLKNTGEHCRTFVLEQEASFKAHSEVTPPPPPQTPPSSSKHACSLGEEPGLFVLDPSLGLLLCQVNRPSRRLGGLQVFCCRSSAAGLLLQVFCCRSFAAGLLL